MKWWSLLALVLVVSAGCEPGELAQVPIPLRAMHGTVGIAYGPGERHELDVWVPGKKVREEPGHGRTVVVFLYGGYWQNGDRTMYRALAYPFVSARCVVVIPDYRLYPQVRFPSFVEDAAQAVGWTRRHIAGFGGDPDRIFLAGHSAGAYIAAMLNYDERYLAAAGVPRGTIKGVMGLATPVHFVPIKEPIMRAIFGEDPSGWARTQPENFIDGDEAPMLLIQGDRDELVRPGSNRLFAEKVREKGGRATAVSYGKMGHSGPLVDMVWPLWGLSDVRGWCLEFMKGNGG